MKPRLIALAALLACSAVHADQTCTFERKMLFVSERPKATMVKRPLLIGPPVAPKPKAKRVKRFDGPRKDGYDWVCDDIAPFEAVAFEHVAPIAAPADEASPVPPAFADLALPSEPTGAGIADTSSYAAAPPVFFGGGGVVFVGGPVVYMPVAAVAEPESYLLILAGLAAIAVTRKVRA